MNNKRIHELLDFLKKRNEIYNALHVDPQESRPLNPWDMGLNRVYEEILQFLLEDNIKNNAGRKFCEEHGNDFEYIILSGEPCVLECLECYKSKIISHAQIFSPSIKTWEDYENRYGKWKGE